MKNTLKIKNLSFNRGSKQIFSNFSIECNTESTTLIVGDNGVGKTTLLNLIAGIEVPTFGSIEFNDTLYQQGPSNKIPTEKRNIGFIFQDLGLFAHLTVKENIYFAKGKISKEEVKLIINILDIGEILDKDVDKISGGQQQRVAIARTLISSPAIILADEPFSNLDDNNNKNIQKFLHTWAKTHNQILILIAHNSQNIITEFTENIISLN